MKVTRWIGCLITLLCLMMGTVAAAENGIVMPAQLHEIREEAFFGDSLLQRIVIPDHVHTIGERAFAYSAIREILLPPSVKEIAADAFMGCEELTAVVYVGSYAHVYCEQNDIAYIFAENGSPYAITGLNMEDGRFVAAVTTEQACILQIQVIHENEETVLYTLKSTAQALLDMQQISIAIEQNMVLPRYFLLRAVLLSEDGYALCNPYTTIQYTQAFEQFEGLEPDDFEDDVVLSFGSGGFGVLQDGAYAIPGTAEKTDSGYIIPSGLIPEAGNVIVLTFPDGTQEPVKVNTAHDNGDGTATVQRDPDVTLSELFKVFKFDREVDVGAAAKNRGIARAPGDNLEESISLSSSLTAGPLSVSVKGTASVSIKVFYNEAFFGDEFVEMQTSLKTNVTAEATFTEAFKLTDLKDAFGRPLSDWEFVLYDGPIVIPDTGIVAVKLRIGIPLEAEIGGAGKFTLKIENTSGVKYTPENGDQPIKKTQTDVKAEVEGGFKVQLGPRVKLSVTFLHSVLEAGVSAQIGGRLTGKATHTEQLVTTGSKIHACEWCADIEGSLFGEAKADIVAKVSKKCKHTLLAVDLFKLNYPIGKWFWSWVNEEESLFGGEPYFDEGECPNYKYRTDIRTLNRDADEISGVLVTLLKDGKLYDSGISPYRVFLYDDDYKARAAFESGVGEKAFTVLRNTQTVTIMEQYMQISGVVTDAETKESVADAQVTITPPEGDVMTASTDAQGRYSIVFDPVESFRLSIEKKGYLTWTRGVEPEAEERQFSADAQLIPAVYTVRFDAGEGSGEMTEFTAYAGEGFTLPECGFTAPEGKEFYFWEIDGESYAPGDKYDSASGDVTVTAMWKAYVPPRRYQVFDINTDWVGASAYCESLGGHLATITSSEEQNEIVQEILNSGGNQNAYWLGGTDQYNEGNWSWITGEPWSYTKWGSGQPDNYISSNYINPTGQQDEDYLALARGNQSWAENTRWNDFANNWSQYVSFGFICEWDLTE